MFVKENVTENEFMLNRITNFLDIPSPKVLSYNKNHMYCFHVKTYDIKVYFVLCKINKCISFIN